jgi:FdhD protein
MPHTEAVSQGKKDNSVEPIIKRNIMKKRGNFSEESDDYVATEKKLSLCTDGGEILTLSCTPVMLRELIVGLLLTEGLITGDLRLPEISISHGDVITVHVPFSADAMVKGSPLSRSLGGFLLNRVTRYRKIQDDFTIAANELITVFREFQEKSELFRLTGCFHSAALSNRKAILAFAEDIGRHNAVDKVIGYSMLNNISPQGKMMIVSCRLSSEILSKCAQWGVPVLASRGASTDLAIQIAEEAGVTLIGFVRGENFNVYTHAQRIV